MAEYNKWLIQYWGQILLPIFWVGFGYLGLLSMVESGNSFLILGSWGIGLVSFIYWVVFIFVYPTTKKNTIKTLVIVRKIYDLKQIDELTGMGNKLVQKILSKLILKGKLSGKIQNQQFIPTISSNQVTPSSIGVNPSSNIANIRTALANLEVKHQKGEIEDSLYWKLKAEYQEKLLNG